jgi:isopenicillin N synthase-like dioxygenase
VKHSDPPHKIGRNAILGLSSEEAFPVPLPLAQARESIKEFMNSCQEVANVIFATLSKALSLDQENGIENYHRPSEPSSYILRLLKYRPIDAEETYRIPQTPHTDIGTLTLLFTDCLGLQVLAPSGASDDWRFVEPKVGHVIVNIGDAWTLLTGGVVKSSLHRVGPPSGQGMPERYSAAYLVRPRDDTVLKPLSSELGRRDSGTEVESMRFREWMVKKFSV